MSTDLSSDAERRRHGGDRRKRSIPVAVERRSGKERRQDKGERRRQVDPTTCEKDYSDDEITFFKSVGASIEDLAAAVAVYEAG